MSPQELNLINYFFRSFFPNRSDVVLGFGDDAALCKVPEYHQLAISVNTFNEGIHFPYNASPEAVGYKTLAISLSDLAAIGAMPVWFTLALSQQQIREQWLSNFCKGLKHLTDLYHIALINGDITHGALSITLQIMGYIADGQGMRRSGARKGDGIYVSGTLGDAGIGLAIALKTCIKNMDEEKNNLVKKLPVELAEYFQQRFAFPSPRLSLGLCLKNIANSAVNISEGLAVDLSNILKESNVGAMLRLEHLPFSLAMQTAIQQGYFSEQQALQWALNSSNDYELCFTIPAERELSYASFLANHGVHKVGVITDSHCLEYKYKQKSWIVETTDF